MFYNNGDCMKKFMLVFVNLLTMVRIIGVFMIVPIFFTYGGVSAAILSVACYLTDCIDGFLARKYHVATFFGSMFDGVADKLFSCSNLIILFKVTSYSIISIIFEIAIVLVQLVKFQKNVNIQSSKLGKIKTIIMSITVILIYLITDIKKLSFLGDKFINYIVSINPDTLYCILFIPLYIFQILTLYSYLKFLKTYNFKEEHHAPKVDIKLKPKTSIKNRFANFCTLWLNNEFYEKYKDSQGLREIRKSIKNNERVK